MMSQLVLRSDGRPEGVDVVANPGNAPSISFENRDAGVYIPRLGSQDFIRLAVRALQRGWEVERFEILDSTQSSVGESREHEVSEAIATAASIGGITAAVSLLTTSYPTFSVSGVELVASDDTSVILRRGGVLLTDEGASPKSFIEDIWRPSRVA